MWFTDERGADKSLSSELGKQKEMMDEPSALAIQLGSDNESNVQPLIRTLAPKTPPNSYTWYWDFIQLPLKSINRLSLTSARRTSGPRAEAGLLSCDLQIFLHFGWGGDKTDRTLV